MNLEADGRCALCREAESIYRCSQCGRSICEPCSAAAPGWAFVCLDCFDAFGWHDLTGGEEEDRGGELP